MKRGIQSIVLERCPQFRSATYAALSHCGPTIPIYFRGNQIAALNIDSIT